MISAAIFPGRYIQGIDSLKFLGKEIKRLGENALLISSPSAAKNIIPKITDSISAEIKFKVEIFNKEATDEEISRLTDSAKKNRCDIIAGIGGGKTLDTAKAVANNIKVPVVIVPTIASTDAPCSAISVVYTEKGVFKRVITLDRNPDVVLVDSRIISEAPVRFLVSGMGDALATYFEAESCRQKVACNFTGYNSLITAYSIAELCYETLLEYGISAKISCINKVVNPALEHIIEANTLLSGIGFESCGIAAAHSIHNGLTAIPETHSFFHGEKVAFGLVTSLFLTDKSSQIINEVYNFCENIGLPTTLEEIGLKNVSDKDLMKVSEKSCAEGELIINEPININPEDIFNSIKLADAFGKSRKK
ncbi:glycerol dehydrogenase [Candidatus Dependentiae bacterium]|nr:glycerol dehydrogenase [Candidatus Dependentiae bacterium]